MKQEPRFKPMQVLMMGVLIVAVALILAPLVVNVVRDHLLVPVLYAIWLARLYLNAVPQLVYWAVLLGIGVLLAIQSLYYWSPRLRPRARPTPPAAGQVSRLSNWVAESSRGQYFRQHLLRRLIRITLRLHGHSDRLHATETAALLASDQLSLPEDVHAILEEGMTSTAYDLDDHMNLVKRFTGWLTGWLPRTRSRPPIDPALTRLVEYLEEKLEIPHDEPNP